MPISDGYEACKKILRLYSEKKVFNNQNQHEMMKYFAPLMLACSSDNLEFPAIKKDIKEAGFDMAMSAPLNA